MHITQFQAAAGQETTLAALLTEGRDRMRAAAGCQSMDLYREEGDDRSFTFLQSWSSHEAHDAAFGERIIESGHLDKVLATLAERLVQRSYTLEP